MRDLKWKVLSTKYVYENKWFHAKADSCMLPDGRIIEPYFVVELPNFCNMFIVTKEERVVMVRQYRYPIDQTTYELAGGIIEKDENPETAALREMQEETGYTSGEVEYLFTAAANPALMNNIAYFFLAKNAEKIESTNFDELEDLDVVSFSKEEFLQMLKENKFMHGVQLGAMYESMIRLGWLKFE
ncbi:ADP-ribose pyrophosphatase [mine drainage metagenome]|uniref:ADP-ribose pyrophosphatase n=1 Tax=mine drainage metagenome TaxID=410659 RepID=A0A1J5SBB0_9ZZZZ